MTEFSRNSVSDIDTTTSKSTGAAFGLIVGGREEQQDACAMWPLQDEKNTSGELLLLADGMGGHAGGQAAANLAIETYHEAISDSPNLPIKQRLHNAVLKANEAIGCHIEAQPELSGMGCTIVAVALFNDGQMFWVSVGDSHLLRSQGRILEKINADHSMAPQIDQQVKDGEISAEEGQHHPDRNVLVSALTGHRIGLIDQGECKLGEGDQIILASDGLDILADEEIVSYVTKFSLPNLIVKNLLAAVLDKRNPDQDNTAIVVSSKVNVSNAMNSKRKLSIPSWALLFFAISGAAILGSALTWLYLDQQSDVPIANQQTQDQLLSSPPLAEQAGNEIEGKIPAKKNSPEREKRNDNNIHSANELLKKEIKSETQPSQKPVIGVKKDPSQSKKKVVKVTPAAPIDVAPKVTIQPETPIEAAPLSVHDDEKVIQPSEQKAITPEEN